MGGYVPDETVREILQRIDLVRLVGESVDLRKAGTRFVGLCPFHAEKTPSFSVNGEQGFYYCFGCHAGGDAITFLREQQGLDFREALEQLASRTGIALPEEEAPDERTLRARARERSEKSKVFEANALAQSFFRATYRQELGAEARAYVEGRGISEETVERFGIGAAPRAWDALTLHLRRNKVAAPIVERSGLVAQRSSGGGSYDRFRGRLTFPVLDVSGKVLGFSARLIDNEEQAPKFVNSPESPVFQKGQTFLGLYQARRALRASRRAVIVEGNVDVVMLAQAGIENVVAPMGTALTEAHVLLIKRFVDSVDLLFDGDNAGRAAARKALELALAHGLGGRIALLPQGEDPDSLVRQGGADAVATLLARAPALSDHFVDEALGLYDGSVPSKTAVVEAVRPLFEWLESDVERDEYERRIEQHIGLPPGGLKRYIEVPEALVRLGVPEDSARTKAPRADSRAEIELLELMLAYPPLLERFEADGGLSLMQGEKRRWLAERCLAHYDRWKGTWRDAWAFLSELDNPKIRGFAAKAIQEEPRIPEADSDNAYADCLERLRTFETRERQRALSAKQAKGGDLTSDDIEILRERMRLSYGSQPPGAASPGGDVSDDGDSPSYEESAAAGADPTGTGSPETGEEWPKK